MVWPIPILTNMLTALKGSKFYFIFWGGGVGGGGLHVRDRIIKLMRRVRS